jgi:hypothetical protein
MNARGPGEAASTLARVIDVRLLRTDLPGVRAAIARRGAPELVVQVDEAAALDGRLRELTSSRDDTRRRVNELSKQVGQLRRDGANDEAERLMAESRDLGQAEARWPTRPLRWKPSCASSSCASPTCRRSRRPTG